MAMPQTITATRHAYANGEFKRMLIDGEWVDAASGKTFESRNPATGELLATVAEGDAEDINRAVAAARRAFEGRGASSSRTSGSGSCSSSPTSSRSISTSSACSTRSTWARRSAARAATAGACSACCAGTPGMATAIHGETIENSLPGEYLLLHAEGAGRRRRRDHSRGTGRCGATIWKIGPALATGCTIVLKPAEEAPLTSLRLGELMLEAGVPPGVVNIVPGYGETAGAALGRASGRRQGRLHRLAPDRPEDRAGLCRQSEARVARARRQVARHRLRRRRSRRRRFRAPAMAVFANSGQICSAGTRLFVERQGLRRVRRAGRRVRQGSARRQRPRSRHPDRPAGLGAAARPGDRLSSTSAGRRAPGASSAASA